MTSSENSTPVSNNLEAAMEKVARTRRRYQALNDRVFNAGIDGLNLDCQFELMDARDVAKEEYLAALDERSQILNSERSAQ